MNKESEKITEYEKKLYSKMKPFEFWLLNLTEQASDSEVSANRERILNQIMDYSQIVELDERLVGLIESTDNQIFYRPLFFNNILINTNLRCFGDYIMKGLLIHIVPKEGEWGIQTILLNVNTLDFIRFTIHLIDNYEQDKSPKEIIDLKKEAAPYMRRMACNIVDLVENNDADIDVTTIKPTKEQQEKRRLRNKSILPTKVYIRPKTHFIKYLNEFNKSPNPRLPPRILVRGHWRHYRDERYSSKLRQKPQWIKPFYKGMGFIKQSVYKIMPPADDKRGET